MSERTDKALERHHKGYNCAQAVACTFAEQLGLDESVVYKMTEGFGFGMGNSRGVCGAMSGAAAVAGLLGSDGNTEQAGGTKGRTYKTVAMMQKKFEERANALICRDIKMGENGVQITSCDECVRIATEIVEEDLGL